MSTASRQKAGADAIRVREFLAAANDSSRVGGPGGPLRGRRLQPGTPVQELIADRLARIDLDADTVEAALAAERPANEHLLNELKADAVAQSAAQAVALNQMVDDYAANLGGLVLTTQSETTHYVALDSPSDIGADIIIESFTREPYHSRAKVRLDVADDGTSGIFGASLETVQTNALHFYYPWSNPHDDAYAIVTISAILVLNGFCSAHSNGGVFSGGNGDLALIPRLDLLPSWMESPVVPQPSQSVTPLQINADSGGFLSDDQTAFEVIFRGFFVSYEQLFVPPGESVKLIPSLEFSSRVQDGSVSADFATGEFCVQSPLVQLAYLVVPNSS